MNGSDNQISFFIVAFAICLFVALIDAAVNHDGQPNNEPYTGLCVEPTPQGGC